MNIIENINKIIKSKGLTRKYFVDQLLLLNPILKSTGESPSVSTIYGYLNGNREVKIELLPYVAKVLDIDIFELFEEGRKSRLKTLQDILKSPEKSELLLLEKHFKTEEILHTQKLQNDKNYNSYKYIFSMLPYSSEKFLHILIDVLESFKDSTIKAEQEIKQSIK